ncbi:MAG: phosphoglucomutase/phosphomannomutase family protein [Armatimonadota bacterium]
MAAISFGTEGWRALLADDYTFANVRRVAAAAAAWFKLQAQTGPVAVGHDTRFMGDRFGAAVADELAAAGLEARLCTGPLPTPAVSYYVTANRLAGGIILTASHNAAEYNGFKVKTAVGASIEQEGAKWIEVEANRLAKPRSHFLPAPRSAPARFDTREEYLNRVVSLVEREAIAKAKLRVVADLMHGAGIGYFDEALRRVGCAELSVIRGEPDPTFDWKRPEPIGRYLEPSVPLTRDPSVSVGLATDGDGDRFGLMADGEYVDIQQAIVLILYHLLKNRNERGRVLRSLNVTSMVDRLCEHFGCGVKETSVGFKNIGPEMARSEDVILGVEESGGFAMRGHLPDRDGTLAALRVCEALAMEGKPVREILADAYRLIGGRRYFDRLDVEVLPEQRKRLSRRIPKLRPRRLAGQKVAEASHLDGAKLTRSDGSWLLARVSGTEPLVRVYAEAWSPADVEALLADGREVILRAAER